MLCRLWETLPTELAASCQPFRTPCHFFTESSSFQAQPPSQGLPGNLSPAPEAKQNFSLLKHFSPWQLANPLPGFSSNLDKITAENPSCSPPPVQSNPKGGMVPRGPPAGLHLISLLSMEWGSVSRAVPVTSTQLFCQVPFH